MVRQRRGVDREEVERRDSEERQSIEWKQQDPAKAMERVLGPAAVPGLRTAGVGGPVRCSQSVVENMISRGEGG